MDKNDKKIIRGKGPRFKMLMCAAAGKETARSKNF